MYRGWSGLNQINVSLTMLHMEGQAQHVEGVLQGIVRVDPVCMEGVFARAEWDQL